MESQQQLLDLTLRFLPEPSSASVSVESPTAPIIVPTFCFSIVSCKAGVDAEEVIAAAAAGGGGEEDRCRTMELFQVSKEENDGVTKKKTRRGPKSRSSQYRGVTFYWRTCRWESHIWECGKQVCLGGFDTAHADRAYDRAVIKFRGVNADINFDISDYEADTKQMVNFTKEEFVQVLRRQSTGLTRGSSKYKGGSRDKCIRLEAQMRQFLQKKECSRSTTKCNNGNGAALNFRDDVYTKEDMITSGCEDGTHFLDLKLGIATPLYNMNCGANYLPVRFKLTDIPCRERLMGAAIEKRREVDFSSEFGGPSPQKTTLPSFSTAASSGFSSQWSQLRCMSGLNGGGDT